MTRLTIHSEDGVIAAKRLVSMNTGLTTRVGHYGNRSRALPGVLDQLDADVICLQEVWYSDDMERILNHFGPRMHSFSALHDAHGRMRPVSEFATPCASLSFVLYYAPCFIWHCNSGTNHDKLRCGIERCGIMDLEQQCLTCLILSDYSQLFTSCLRTFGRQFNSPGLLLLSKTPMTNVRITPFHPPHKKTLIPRSYIGADVDGVGRVLCTHMTANLGQYYFEPNLPYGSWSQQNLAEAHTLMTALLNQPRAVIMGDFNSSPGNYGNDISPDFPVTVEYLKSSGLEASYMEWLAICSWCSYNPLTKGEKSFLYDHIFTRNHTVILARRLMDSPLSVPVSDHYGIEILISP